MAERRGIDYVRATIQKSGVAFTQLWVTDVRGLVRGVTVTGAQLDHALEDGIALSGDVFGAASELVGEVLVLPDPQTYAVLPAAGPSPPVARMFCDVVTPDGAGSPYDVRGVLKRTLGRASNLGYAVMLGARIDHTYLDTSAVPPVPVGAAAPLLLRRGDDPDGLVQETVLALEQLGGGVNAFARGAGAGQFQVELAPSDALSLGDALVTHRRLVAELARAKGLCASFMPYPRADAARNGLELSVALFDDGEPAFLDDGTGATATAAATAFAAGLRRSGPELSLLARATVNSYTQPAGPDLVRFRQAGGVQEGGAVIYHGADASANPYLIIAAMLEAGLAGIRAGGAAGEAARAPVTLAGATELAERSGLIRQTLGDELVTVLVSEARRDGAHYRSQVTAWERDRYLDAH